MRLTCALVAGTLALACGATGCRDNSGVRYEPPDQDVVSRSTTDAEALLAHSPVKGFADRPVASGHDRADDTGKEIEETAPGRALFQVACSGTGHVTVTLPGRDVSRLVTCGKPAARFPFRQDLRALVVGERDSTGVYAWRILPESDATSRS